MNQDITLYAEQHYLHESATLSALRQYALTHDYAHNMTPPLQTQYLQSLCRLMQVHRAIEVGCFLGYTTLALAEVLPAGGRVIACERHAGWIEKARPFWRQAGVDQKIDVRLGDAQVALQAMLQAGDHQSIDLIYVDADKQNYPHYLELGLELLSSTGVMVFDNAFSVHHGHAADPQTPTTRALDRFNKMLSQRKDIVSTMLPMFDGLVLVYR